MYIDASEFVENLIITQFQILLESLKSVKVSIIYDAVTFFLIERRYVIYKRKLCAMIKFAFKYHYLL